MKILIVLGFILLPFILAALIFTVVSSRSERRREKQLEESLKSFAGG